jgi:hypothetical protein|tara:strand:+ start:1819 stop:2160 length:342 start_codon:yes stop_codon:yes gene_type:complete
MMLSPVALAVTAAVIWGAAIFVIGTINALVPGYGDTVLTLVVSIYPGYAASGTLGDLIQGTAYAIFDGLVGGFIFALLYNRVVRFTSPTAKITTETAPVAPQNTENSGQATSE